MACTLSNKCAKNLSKRTVLLQLIIKNVVICFFGTQCRWPGPPTVTRSLTRNRNNKCVSKMHICKTGGGGMQLKLFATWYPRPLFKGNISIAILYAPYLAYSKLGLYGIDFLKISVRFRFVFLKPGFSSECVRFYLV